MRIIIFTNIILGMLLPLFAEVGFEYRGVDVNVTRNGKSVHYLVKRERPSKCRKMPQSNEMIWSGAYAGAKVPPECRRTFVYTAGKISPIHMDEEIQTYGELEVLYFLKEMQHDKSKVLIDARKEPWFNYRTIPGAVNMPYYYFRDKAHYPEEFAYAMRYLGGKLDKDGHYEFDDPKTIVVFCNGPWCTLSSKFIQAITEAGFPHEHIKWYRDGLQGWLISGFTSTRPIGEGAK